MARVTPFTPSQIALSRRVLGLRLALKISRAQFAQMVGMTTDVMSSKELCRVPFRQHDIDQIKERVAAHLAASSRALEDFTN